ncbi:elongation factor P [Candidatus Nomurabacteria bacterium]|nr:elongation factor P [Candidatus Nomurabacteria bacterium]MCB9820883.1 elongation factor P [Candidatus Nomurabacteria bacterium]
MTLLNYNEIKTGKVVIYEGQPCVVLDYHIARTQQRKPQNQVKLRNLITGNGTNATFRTSDTLEEADVSKQDITFLYTNKGEYWFCEGADRSKRFMLDEESVGDSKKFLKENMSLQAIVFDNGEEAKIIGVKLPIKVDFQVKDAPPSIKGDTATGGTKQVTLENGTTINAPLFIEIGEKIVVNTETGEYVERAK